MIEVSVPKRHNIYDDNSSESDDATAPNSLSGCLRSVVCQARPSGRSYLGIVFWFFASSLFQIRKWSSSMSERFLLPLIPLRSNYNT